MKDIPMFTTENGVAGLTLQEIPLTQRAYVTVHDASDLTALLQECVGFCKAVGAQEVYACNHSGLSHYPVYTRILEMERPLCDLPETSASAVVVEAESCAEFVEIYNQKMQNVPGAACLTQQRAREMIEQGMCYFIRRGDRLLGIGVAENNTVLAVASLVPGGGRKAVLALCKGMCDPCVRLEVAEENQKAVCLYEGLGFFVKRIVNIWHKIL